MSVKGQEPKVIGSPLTARELREFAEISRDHRALEETLETVLRYHANQAADIQRRTDDMWREVLAVRGVNIDDSADKHVYRTRRTTGGISEIILEDQTN